MYAVVASLLFAGLACAASPPCYLSSGTTTACYKPINTASGGTGLTALGTANQILGINAGGTGTEFKTVAVGTAGTDFAVANAANSVTLNLPDAGASARGAVTTGTQTFAGAKTFSSASGVSLTGGYLNLSTVRGSAAIANLYAVTGSNGGESGDTACAAVSGHSGICFVCIATASDTNVACSSTSNTRVCGCLDDND